jgi:DNA processing protein
MPADRDRIDHLRLVRTEGVGPVTYRRLLDRYRTPAAALDALPRLAQSGGRAKPPVIPTPAAAEAEFARTIKAGGRIVFTSDADYPALLAMMDDAPPCLIVQGDMAPAAERCVAAVGGRNASINGQRMAETLASELAQHVTVVSGLARGIDTAAHTGAMRTGRTIAVIAGGIDCPYPPENADLQRRIAEQHLIVTEAPIGTVPQARHFPRRNRIIAGLSLGVVVVEAAPRSGSLITARIAQEQGREVFAVPGSPLDPRARGGNDLIRQGAVLVENAADVLENLPMTSRELADRRRPAWAPKEGMEPVADAPESEEDACSTVLSCLSADPTMVDDLLRRCQLSPSVTMAVLLELELAGRVETLPGNRVARLPDAFA